MRKDILADREVYHIFTKSIAKYKIFNDDQSYERMQQIIKYYQVDNDIRYSDFLKLKIVNINGFHNHFNKIKQENENIVQVIAYCLMPTHIHLVLKQLLPNGISCYMKNVLNSYTRYFNTKYKRKGPLWESRFKNVLINNNEQLQHLVRYLHLNPTTANLVKLPENWKYSSYKEYLLEASKETIICQFDDILDINQSVYRKFTNDQISYQRELANIKKLLF